MLTLAMFVGLLVASLLTSAGLLWLCARIVRGGHPSFKRAFICAVLLSIIGIGSQLVAAGMRATDTASFLILLGGQLVVLLVSTWAITARVLGISFTRSLLLSIAYYFLSIPAVFGLVYVVKTHCMEAFAIPSNNMAPTFVGWHHEAVCPHCQGKVIVSGRPPDEPDIFFGRDQQPKNGICTLCRKISEFDKWPEETHGPVRIICIKLMQPKRGEPVVFVHPRRLDDDGKKLLYVMRLIGLPGEKIEIKDDAVWINDQKWTPPPDLSGVEYTSRATGTLPDEWAKEARTWDLGPDEYFFLGDFTTNSSDSREWGPVPRANLVGPATLIYWPPSAWRVLR